MTLGGSQKQGHHHWLVKGDEPQRKRIDAHDIVEQAHELVHEGGTAALSMRPLASALGTSTSALYRKFPSKEWLLIAVVDYVLSDVVTEPDHSEAMNPRERLEQLSISLRDVLSSHPHLHEILTSRVTVTPNTIRIAERSFSCLRGLGVGDSELVDAYNAWAGYVIGFTAIETTPPGSIPDPGLQEAMRRQLEESGGAAPTINGLRLQVANTAFGLRWFPGRFGAAQSSFDWGLGALLDGFQTNGRRRPR